MALGNQNKVKYMATQLLAKFEENAPPQSVGVRRQVGPTHPPGPGLASEEGAGESYWDPDKQAKVWRRQPQPETS